MHQHIVKVWLHRTARALIATLVLAAGLVAVQAVTAEPAAAASTLRTMTRTEIVERARFWVVTGTTYTQTGTFAQEAPSGTQTYRRDCSGLVSMAWDLGTSPVTGNFINDPSSGDWTTLTGATRAAQANQLLPGDAMVWHNSGKGHIELFVGWKNPSDHTQGAYVYSFNSDGQTVQHPNANNNFGYLGFNSWTDITTTFTKYIRRANVVNDTFSPSSSVCSYTANSGAKVYAGPGYAYRGESVTAGTRRSAHLNTFTNPFTWKLLNGKYVTGGSLWLKVANTNNWIAQSQWTYSGCGV
jgi:hypothetical protein